MFEVICRHLDSVVVDAVAVEKRKTGPALQDTQKFYPRMMGYLLRFVLERTRDYSQAIIITDSIPHKKQRRAIEKAVKMTMSQMIPPGVTYQMHHHDSRTNMGIQLADYCTWAIGRKWERGDRRSYDLIQPAIRSDFDIFKTGRTYY